VIPQGGVKLRGRETKWVKRKEVIKRRGEELRNAKSVEGGGRRHHD